MNAFLHSCPGCFSTMDRMSATAEMLHFACKITEHGVNTIKLVQECCVQKLTQAQTVRATFQLC